MGLHQAGSQYQWGSPGQISGPVLLNDFINELDTGIKCTLIKFANNTQLGRAAESFESRVLQRDQYRLESWES